MITTCNITYNFVCLQDYMKHNIDPLTAGLSIHTSTILFLIKFIIPFTFFSYFIRHSILQVYELTQKLILHFYIYFKYSNLLE